MSTESPKVLDVDLLEDLETLFRIILSSVISEKNGGSKKDLGPSRGET